MLKLLLVSSDKDALSDLASALVQHSDVDLSWAESGTTALSIVSDAAVDLIVTDEMLKDMTGLEFAGRLLAVNPMIHCASVSRLSPEEFHEVSEGMGLMAQLPVKPDEAQAEALLQRLKYIKGLTDRVRDK
ncbi:MAG: response regulator [Desulfobacterales bacterium]|nr:response regulator [Desulfobacterales bacterium]